jgi:hypothetical protein
MACHQHIDNPDMQIDRQHSSYLLTSIYISEQEHQLLILLYPIGLKGKVPLDKLSYFVTDDHHSRPSNANQLLLAIACHKIDRIQDMVVFQGNPGSCALRAVPGSSSGEDAQML